VGYEHDRATRDKDQCRRTNRRSGSDTKDCPYADNDERSPCNATHPGLVHPATDQAARENRHGTGNHQGERRAEKHGQLASLSISCKKLRCKLRFVRDPGKKNRDEDGTYRFQVHQQSPPVQLNFLLFWF
jgi:hypothetical protein